MITLDFYEEIKISESPLNFESLKQKISELYILNKEQLNHIIISYLNEYNIRRYITDDYDYQNILPLIEFYIINIELTDDYYYLIDEEKPTIQFEKFLPTPDFTTKKEKKKNEEEIIFDDEIFEDYNEEFYDTEYNNEEEEDLKEEKQEKKENVNSDIDCNNCNNEINGIRYLCGVCENFNLCDNCEKKVGEEHGHPLLKIRNNDMCPISFSCTIENKDN